MAKRTVHVSQETWEWLHGQRLRTGATVGETVDRMVEEARRPVGTKAPRLRIPEDPDSGVFDPGEERARLEGEKKREAFPVAPERRPLGMACPECGGIGVHQRTCKTGRKV